MSTPGTTGIVVRMSSSSVSFGCPRSRGVRDLGSGSPAACPILPPSFGGRVGDDKPGTAVFGRVITQHPLFFPSVSKYSTPFCFSNSNAASQKCRCRISLSRGRKSYSMSRRSMVSRCRRNTAVEMSSAISASSLPPCSMACSASDRAFSCSLSAFVPLRDASVEIPAVIIKTRRGIDQCHNVRLRLASPVE